MAKADEEVGARQMLRLRVSVADVELRAVEVMGLVVVVARVMGEVVDAFVVVDTGLIAIETRVEVVAAFVVTELDLRRPGLCQSSFPERAMATDLVAVLDTLLVPEVLTRAGSTATHVYSAKFTAGKEKRRTDVVLSAVEESPVAMVSRSIVVPSPDDVRGRVVGVERTFRALGREASCAAPGAPPGVDGGRNRARVGGRSRDVAFESGLRRSVR